MNRLALAIALSALGCGAALPAVPSAPTDIFFSEAVTDQKVGHLMADSAQRCRTRLAELRSSASHYRTMATVLSILSGSIGVVAGTASATLPSDRSTEIKALAITAAIAAGLTPIITPVLQPDARELAYLVAYNRWQTANVRLRSMYTSEPLTAATDSAAEAGSSVPALRTERFQQAWSAMANDLDACAGQSWR
jgi:hypothetical protein